MSETAPPMIDENRPMFESSQDSNGQWRTYTKEGKDGPKTRIGEEELLNSTGGHELEDRSDYKAGYYYGLGNNDSQEGVRRIEIATPEAEVPTTLETPPTAETPPAAEVAPPSPTPEPAVVPPETAPAPSLDPEVEPEEATPPSEATPAAGAEREAGHETYRREAIDPERIRELKDRFETEYRRELELHNIRTDEDRKKDPYLVESSRNYVRDRILRDYLKIAERDWDPAELAEVRSDVAHMLELSNTTLDNLMLRPEGETAAAATDEPENAETAEENGPPLNKWDRVKFYAYPPNAIRTLRDKFRKKDREVIEKDRRRGAGWIALGAFAAGLLVDVVEDALEAKHGIPKSGVGRHIHETQHGVGFGHHGHGLGDSHQHIETFNEQNGHRFVQSILPDNLKQEPIHGISGPEHIVDRNTGQVIVDHVTYKGNRAYSDGTLHQLHQHGYNTDLTHNSIFDNDGGPGPRGQVNGGYASEVLPINR